MQTTSMLGPILAQVLLTIGVYVLLGRRKFAAVKAGEVDRSATARTPGCMSAPTAFRTDSDCSGSACCCC